MATAMLGVRAARAALCLSAQAPRAATVSLTLRTLASSSSPEPTTPLGPGRATPVMEYPPPPPAKLGRPTTLGGWIANTLLYATGMQSRDAVGMRRAREAYKRAGVIYEERRDFFGEACALPDTFQSWFLVTHLHCWLLTQRLRAEGAEGAAVTKQLMQLFFDDCEQRMADIGVNRIDRHMRLMISQYYGVSLAYDDGIVNDDTVLGEAIWRNMTDMKGSPVEVLRLVEYTRQQCAALDAASGEDVLQGRFVFLPPGGR